MEDRKMTFDYVSQATLSVSSTHFKGSRGVETFISNGGTVGYWDPVKGLTGVGKKIEGLSNEDKLKLATLCLESYLEALNGPTYEMGCGGAFG